MNHRLKLVVKKSKSGFNRLIEKPMYVNLGDSDTEPEGSVSRSYMCSKLLSDNIYTYSIKQC